LNRHRKPIAAGLGGGRYPAVTCQGSNVPVSPKRCGTVPLGDENCSQSGRNTFCFSRRCPWARPGPAWLGGWPRFGRHPGGLGGAHGHDRLTLAAYGPPRGPKSPRSKHHSGKPPRMATRGCDGLGYADAEERVGVSTSVSRGLAPEDRHARVEEGQADDRQEVAAVDVLALAGEERHREDHERD